MLDQDTLGPLAFSPGEEQWIEFGPPDARRRIGFHDYAEIYAVPGLYERVFYTELGMRSTHVVVGLVAQMLEQAGRDARQERVLDIGAGNGMGGEELRAAGIGAVLGVDLEPQARVGALRDRPGVYDEYLVGDLTARLDELRAFAPTTVVALSALGFGHAPPAVLDAALRLLAPGGLFAFAVKPVLTPESDDPAGRETGYPDYLRALFEERADVLHRVEYVHRRFTNGTDDYAVAFAGRIRTVS